MFLTKVAVSARHLSHSVFTSACCGVSFAAGLFSSFRISSMVFRLASGVGLLLPLELRFGLARLFRGLHQGLVGQRRALLWTD